MMNDAFVDSGLRETLRAWAYKIDRELREELDLDDEQRPEVLRTLAEALLELGHAGREGAGE